MTRVAVTTVQDTAQRVADIISERGLVPILLPCISISPSGPDVLAGLRKEAADADLIFVTSARAVRILWPDRDMPPVPTAAVGPRTAQAVTEAGGTVEEVGSDGAASLAQQVDADGRRIVFPHARAADPSTTRTLVERGAEVFAETAYTTIPIAPDDTKVDAAIFGSPSAIDGWLIRRHLDDMVVAAMGKKTATALRVRGVDDPVVPARPGFEAVVDALAERVAG